MSTGLPTKRVTLDGVAFEITALPGTRGYALWLRLLKTIGPGLEGVGSADGAEAAMLKAMGGALSALSLEDAEHVRSEFAQFSCVESPAGSGKMPRVADVFDMFFAGKPKLVGKWMFECLKLNFADFLDASFTSAISQLLATRAPSPVKSQTI